MNKKVNSIVWVCFVALLSVARAADDNWTAAGADTRVSTVENWETGAVPTHHMRFSDGAAGKTVTFDRNYALANYLWVGSATAEKFYVPATETTAEVFNPVIWEATEAENGLTQKEASFRIADANNQNGALQIESGRYTSGSDWWIGYNGGKGKAVLNGGSIEGYNLFVGHGGGAYGELIVKNGGQVSTRANILIADNDASSTGTLVIENGDVLSAGDVNVSTKGTGSVTIGSGDPKVPASLTVPTGKWMYLAKESTASGTLTLKAGGVLNTPFMSTRSANATLVFDGGTLRKTATGPNEYIFKSDNNTGTATIQVTENGGTIDVGDFGGRIDFPMSLAEGATKATLTKKGSGPLTLVGLQGDETAAFAMVVEEGVLALRAGTYLSSLTLGDNSFVCMKGATAADKVVLTVKSDISAYAEKIVCSGYKTSVFQEDGVWKVKTVAYGESEVVPTYWIGGTKAAWTDSGSWTDGVPTAESKACVLHSGIATISEDVNVKSLTLGKAVVFSVYKSGSNWPNLRAEEITGEGRLVLSSCGLKPITEKTLTVYVDVEADPTVAGMNQDCWIEGNDETSRIEIYGTVTGRSAIRVNKGMTIRNGGKLVFGCRPDDDNYFRNSLIEAGGTIEVLDGGWAELSSSSTYAEGSIFRVHSNGELKITESTVIAGNLVGEGLVTCETSDQKPVTLSGNNEEFAGTVQKLNRGPLRLDSETAGSAKASWIIGGDIRSNVASGTLRFGQIDYHRTNDWYVCYAENATGENFLTFEIGAKGGNSNLGTANGICQGSNNLNIRKVGTGNLDLWFNIYQNIDIHEGTASFQNDNGPSLTYQFTGGTMKLPYVPTWSFLDRIKNSTGPVSIDTDGVDISFYQKGTINNSNTGGLTKKGEGVLVFWSDLAYTGSTTVEGGSLLIKGGLADNAGGAVTVSEGAELKLYVDHISFTDGEATAVFNGTIDEESVERVVITGKNNEFVVSAGEGVVLATASPADNAVPNRWIGISADHWTTAANWTKGVPANEQTIEIDYTARIANIQGSINLNKIIVAAGVEAQFVTRNYKTHPSINVNAIEIPGEGEATIALDHCGVQSRVGQYEVPENLNFRMVSTTTDSWLRNLNLKGKLLGNGILRPYTVHFYGDNSAFEGKIAVLDAGSRICDTAASLPNGILELAHDISFDIMEGTFKIGSLDTHEQRLWYTKAGSKAVIEVGHRNENFGRADSKYFFGPESYSAIEVPKLTFKKVGTGMWTNSMKGLRHIIVEEGELALVNCPCEDYKFDNNHGYEIDTLVVKKGAALTGSSGTQPIYSLTLEPGAILKTTLSEVTTGEGEDAVTTVVQSAWPTVTGSVDVQGAYGVVEGAELLAPNAEYTLLGVTGEGNSLTGHAWLQKDETYPKGTWVVKTRPQKAVVGEMQGFILLLR